MSILINSFALLTFITLESIINAGYKYIFIQKYIIFRIFLFDIIYFYIYRNKTYVFIKF